MDVIGEGGVSLSRLSEKARENKMVSTYAPIELMLAATGINPKDLQGKSILNAGSGIRTHWGFELTQKYGIVAAIFVNLDIKHALRPTLRRVAGELFFGEKAGDIDNLSYKDGLFDLVWASNTRVNLEEFYRVIKPGGTVYVMGGSFTEESLERHRSKLNGANIVVGPVSQQLILKYSSKLDRVQAGILRLEIGRQVLTIKKPAKYPDAP